MVGGEMIRHCVFVKFQPAVPQAERDSIYAALRGLQVKIDGLESAAFGANVNAERLAWGFDEGFIIDFRDAKAQDAYTRHPEHPPIIERLLAAADGGLDGVFCFDMKIE